MQETRSLYLGRTKKEQEKPRKVYGDDSNKSEERIAAVEKQMEAIRTQ